MCSLHLYFENKIDIMVPELFSAPSSSAKITHFTEVDEIPLEFWFMYPYSCSIDDGEQYCWVDKSGLVS